MFDLLIRHGRLVTAETEVQADIAVKDGKVCALLQPGEAAEAAEVVDASGLCVLPGLVDAHMHTQAPFMNITGELTFLQQSECAAHGGVTTFMDFTNTTKGVNVLQAFHDRCAEMASSAIDFSVHGKFVEAGAALEDIPRLIEAGCPTFKMFMTYGRQGVMSTDETLLRVFTLAARHGGLPLIHAESDPIMEFGMARCEAENSFSWRDFAACKPVLCETEAFSRAVLLARYAGSAVLVVHTTCAPCLDIAKAAQADGQPVYVETCPHYLTLTDQLYDRPDGYMALCSPPLRSGDDVPALWKAIQNRTIAVIGSDDCTFTPAEKLRFLERNPDGSIIPDFRKVVNGMPGIETRLPILMTEGVAAGRISLSDLVALASTNPAKLSGCYPRKGTLLPGSDADMVLYDPSATWTMSTKTLHHCAHTFLDGYTARGQVRSVFLRGARIVHNGAFLGAQGGGRFVHRSIAPEFLKGYVRPN